MTCVAHSLDLMAGATLKVPAFYMLAFEKHRNNQPIHRCGVLQPTFCWENNTKHLHLNSSNSTSLSLMMLREISQSKGCLTSPSRRWLPYFIKQLTDLGIQSKIFTYIYSTEVENDIYVKKFLILMCFFHVR